MWLAPDGGQFPEQSGLTMCQLFRNLGHSLGDGPTTDESRGHSS